MLQTVRLALVATLATLLLLLCVPQLAWSRAGGGQSFSSSHGSSGGSRSGGYSGGGGTSYGGGYAYSHSGGGGGGIGFGTFVLIFIIIVIIMIIVAKNQQNQGGGQGMGMMDEGSGGYAPQAPYTDPSAGLSKIRASDPNFSDKVFMDRAQTAFFAIQQAWQKRDLTGCRADLSDGMVRRFQMQIDELAQKNQHNVLENLVVGGMHITEASQEGVFDTIKIKIAASCADYTVDDATKQIVSGARQIQPFVEYWTFVRTTGVTTQAPAGTPGAAQNKAQMCPSCGAPLSIGETGKCSYCGNEVKGMNFDWVVDFIGQASEEAG